MNILAIQSLFSCFACFTIGLYVIGKQPKSPVSRLYWIISLIVAFLSFTEYGYRLADNVIDALFWHRLNGIWPLSVALSVHLVFEFTHVVGKIKKNVALFLIYFSTILLTYSNLSSLTTDQVTRGSWGWEINLAQNISGIVFLLTWLLAITLVELVIFIRYIKKASIIDIKKQAVLFLVGLLVPMVVLMITLSLIGMFGSVILNLTSLSYIISVLLIGLAIVKFGLFGLTPEFIARNTIDRMNIAFILLDAYETLLYVNQSTADLFKVEKDILSGKPLDFLLEGGNSQVYFKSDVRDYFKRKNHDTNFVSELKNADGQILNVAVSVFIQRDKEAILLGYVILIRDISSEMEVQTALLEIEEKYASVLESVVEGYFEMDLKGKLIFINSAVTQITGYSGDELLKENFHRTVSGETLNRLGDIFKAIRGTGKPKRNIRFEYTKKSGELGILEISVSLLQSKEGKLYGYCGLLSDASIKSKIENLLIQSEKMMALGGLAAGIAHEIRNPLGAIISFTQIIRNRLTKASEKNKTAASEAGISMEAIINYLEKREVPNHLDKIMSSGYRINDIIENILNFGKKSKNALKETNIPELLDRTLELASAEYHTQKGINFHKIRIVKEYDPNLPTPLADASALQQVLFNLLKNGAQAMSDNHPVQNPPVFILRVGRDNHDLKIEIEDNGKGMAQETIDRLFEPFYSTKDTGIGLGLSISNYIIDKNFHGTLNVESKLEIGTRFIINFPINYAEGSAS